MIILILGDGDAFYFKFPELEISSCRWDILVTSLELAGGLESQGFLIFLHHPTWHHDAGMVQDEENRLRWFKT